MHRTVFFGSVREAYIYAGGLARRFSSSVGHPTGYKISIDDVHFCTLDPDTAMTTGRAVKAYSGKSP